MLPELALFEPEIPQNTGNIGRLCVGFKTSLSLIGKLGFSLEEKALRRAGLDYWQHLDYSLYPDFESFLAEKKGRPIICLSKFGKKEVYDYSFQPDSILLFGRETTGVPAKLTEKYDIERVCIPVLGEIRSYNLANSAAMALSEAYRQLRN